MHDGLYDELAASERIHWWFQGRRRVVADVLRRHLARSGGQRTILDVGSGTGEMVDMLREFGSVTGLDMSSKAVAYCQTRFGSTVDMRVGRIPDDLTPADVITAFDVLEHLEDDSTALGGIHATLAPDGLFVCTVPAFRFLWSGHDEIHHHHRRYTKAVLRSRLEAAGFEVERITYFNSLLFPAIAGVRLLPRRRTSAGRSDVSIPPRLANAFLRLLFGSERWLLRVVSPPAGVSLLAVARKPAASSDSRPAGRDRVVGAA